MPLTRLRQTVRVARVALHLVAGLSLSATVFPVAGRSGRAAMFRWWSRRMLHILRVRVRRHGDAAAAPHPASVLVVSNHVSWLDIFVIRSALECRFVAKSDIRQWPLVGWLVAKQGTVFVQRARRHDTARVNDALDTALAGGDRMVLFAEGTTTDGTEVKPFHGALLQPVVLAEGFVQPLALRYPLADGTPNLRAAYAGEISLWDSLLQLTAQREIAADLIFLPAVHAAGRHRRDLARHCAEQVADALSLPRPDRGPGTRFDPPA